MKYFYITFTYLIGLHTAQQKEVFAFDHFDCFLTAGYEFPHMRDRFKKPPSQKA